MFNSNPLIVSLESDDLQYCQLLEQLRRTGHVLVSCSDFSSFTDVLASGRSIDLLVMPAQQDQEQWLQVSALSKVLSLPILLVVPSDGLRPRALPKELLNSGVIVDLITSLVTDEELQWRAHGLLNRARTHPRRLIEHKDITIGDYRFLVQERVVLHRGRPITLQPRQFDVAQALFQNVGRVVMRDWLWSTLWREESGSDTRAVDVCVANVRRKLELHIQNGFTVRAVYRRGYMLCSEESIISINSNANSRHAGIQDGAGFLDR